MELFETIFARRSYRGMYEKTPVPREDLKKIMEAALAAPSGCNKQTTSVIAVDDPELMGQLGGMLAPHFASAPACLCILTENKIAYKDRTLYIMLDGSSGGLTLGFADGYTEEKATPGELDHAIAGLLKKEFAEKADPQ
ncbi:MAG: nitroreductase family protein [Clostridia bacterium]|nr:nitroreductase family protein [Clostridia bacterium]